MFLNSLLLGLSLLKNFQVWLLIVCLLLAYMAYLMGIRLTTNLREMEESAGPGCLVHVIGVLLQGFLLGTFVLLLLPILLGTQREISWNLIESYLLLAARAGVLAVLLVTVLSFLPYLGSFLRGSPGLEAFLVGVIIFRFTSPLFIERFFTAQIKTPRYPNLWESLGYLFLALVLTKTLMVGIRSLTLIWKTSPRRLQFLSGVLGPTLDIFGGILALLMYASYVKLSL